MCESQSHRRLSLYILIGWWANIYIFIKSLYIKKNRMYFIFLLSFHFDISNIIYDQNETHTLVRSLSCRFINCHTIAADDSFFRLNIQEFSYNFDNKFGFVRLSKKKKCVGSIFLFWFLVFVFGSYKIRYINIHTDYKLSL